MNPSPWYAAIQVGAIITYIVSILVLAAVAGAAIWTTRQLAKSVASIAESLELTRKAIASLPETLAKIESVSSELHDLQEGEIKILKAVEKAIRDLVGTIDEFEGMLVKPRERVQRISPTNESEEMAAERRRKERGGSTEMPNLAEVGKNVGTV